MSNIIFTVLDSFGELTESNPFYDTVPMSNQTIRRRPRALVLCETSGMVSNRLRAIGFEVYTVDIEPAEYDDHGYHHQGDAMDFLHDCRVQRWDLIIAHPPCTALAVSGNRWYGKGKRYHHERLASIEWTRLLWAECRKRSDRIAFENPVGLMTEALGRPAKCWVQPWQFGHGETKKTGFWTWGLPALKPTDEVAGREQRIWRMGPSPDRAKMRSRTYPGIARAIARQWGGIFTDGIR